MSDGGDCRTAPASPGPLKIVIVFQSEYPESHVLFSSYIRLAHLHLLLNTTEYGGYYGNTVGGGVINN